MDANTLNLLKSASDTSYISDGMKQGMELASQAEGIKQKQQQAEMQKQQVADAKFNGSMGVLKTYGGMSPEMQRKFRPMVEKQVQGYGLDSYAPILDAMDSDPTLKAGVASLAGDTAYLKSRGITLDQLNSQIAANPLSAGEFLHNALADRAEFHKEDQKLASAEKRAAMTANAAEDRADRRAGIQDKKQETSEQRAVTTAFNATDIRQEKIKLNTAAGVSSLLDSIGEGKVIASPNISNQLTNMISKIELGGPGASADREKMGVDTLYTSAQKVLGYIKSNPEEAIPDAYITQLRHEAKALGDRARDNFKSSTDAIIAQYGEGTSLAEKAMRNQQSFLSSYEKSSGGQEKKAAPADQSFLSAAVKKVNPATGKNYTPAEAQAALAKLKGM